jgi:hypothetical protein
VAHIRPAPPVGVRDPALDKLHSKGTMDSKVTPRQRNEENPGHLLMIDLRYSNNVFCGACVAPYGTTAESIKQHLATAKHARNMEKWVQIGDKVRMRRVHSFSGLRATHVCARAAARCAARRLCAPVARARHRPAPRATQRACCARHTHSPSRAHVFSCVC